ncbi:hypothetical protein H3V11_09945 [Snodgrassella sp. W8158]|uniref:hypothetical protein n=1 Tax=Snodgrassella sp. W8158 TaxID=2751018 RepID=UPI0018DB666B|nr:hypothetical protein [Snodgrassella sp. W8158]MBI0182263.1 hypothetical protein [Snodgrassella sp. W8158]
MQIPEEIRQITQIFHQKLPEPVQQTMVTDGVVFDSTDSRSAYAMSDLKLKAASAVHQFAETDKSELDEGETLCDRFLSLLAEGCDENEDGEISDEEAQYIDLAYEAAATYMSRFRVNPDELEAFINDDDEEAAANIQELLRHALPEGKEACLDDIEKFAFDENDGSTEPVLDSAQSNGNQQAVMDALYKKKWVVRQGKKLKIRKRVSGRVILSAGQKKAVRKMHLKSHSGRANLKRLKSMRKREKLGLNK